MIAAVVVRSRRLVIVAVIVVAHSRRLVAGCLVAADIQAVVMVSAVGYYCRIP